MRKVRIFIGSFDRAVTFLSIIDHFPQSMSLRTDSYHVNAKSMLGVMGSDLCHPITLCIEGDEKQQDDRLLRAIRDYLVAEEVIR